MKKRGSTRSGARGRSLDRRAVLAAGAAALAAGCARPGTASADAGAWRAGPSLPEPVQEIYPAALDGAIHVAGGFAAEDGAITGPTARHVVLEAGAENWTDRAALPEPRHHPHLVAARGKIYALGGFRADGPQAVWVMQAQSWAYDPQADVWADAAPAPQRHAETVAALLGGRIHVVGGRAPTGAANASWRDHGDVDRHLVFDLGANGWGSAAPALSARNSAAGAVIDGAWHVVGGRVVGEGNLTAHEVYDPSEDRWRAAAPMPQGQAGLAAAAVGGRLYAFGGEWFGAGGGGVYRQCWSYDPARDAWEGASEDWSPRHGLGAVALGGDIYVIGGARRASGNDTSALVEIFSPG